MGAHPREGGAWGLRFRPCCSRCGRTPLALDHLIITSNAAVRSAGVYVTPATKFLDRLLRPKAIHGLFMVGRSRGQH